MSSKNAESTARLIAMDERMEDFFYLRLSERGLISQEAGEKARERLSEELKDEASANAFKSFADMLIDQL